jgi:ubiquinone/menaquinone biosynthesis C-methylase UbiE
MSISQSVRDHYELADEDSRLQDSEGMLESQRSKQIISRHLLGGGLRVLDVGGGTGPYAFWLSQQGHEVHLVDPVAKHIAIARDRNTRTASPLKLISAGDARELSYPDNIFDCVLLMGPLYHLPELVDRIAALREAVRVLKPGALLVSSYIMRFASMIDGFKDNLVADPEFQAIMMKDLADGRHKGSADGSAKYFTEAYFHRPEEITTEAASAGLRVIEMLPVESFGWTLPNLGDILKDPARNRLLMETIAKVEREPSLMGLSAHALLVCRK